MRSLRPILVAVLLALGACESSGMSTGETVGTLGGAAAGGLLGSQIGKGQGRLLAAVAGTLAGGYLGNRLGAHFSAADRTQAATAERSAVTSGEPTSWSNSDSGNSGRVTPSRSFTDPSGRTCREFEHTVTVDGRPESGRGTACRNANGEWELAEG
jgi:surface antigen